MKCIDLLTSLIKCFVEEDLHGAKKLLVVESGAKSGFLGLELQAELDRAFKVTG